jgi:hypothetical protein
MGRLSREGKMPLHRRRTALEIGATSPAPYCLFNFGFGHYVDRKAWGEAHKQARDHLDVRSLLYLSDQAWAEGHVKTGPDGTYSRIVLGAA